MGFPSGNGVVRGRRGQQGQQLVLPWHVVRVLLMCVRLWFGMWCGSWLMLYGGAGGSSWYVPGHVVEAVIHGLALPFHAVLDPPLELTDLKVRVRVRVRVRVSCSA